MIEIIPSILVESAKEFEKRLRLVENHVKTIHVDILDGTLFPHTCWFDAEAVGAMDTPVNFELHLMVSNPLPIIAEWKSSVPSTVRAIFHAEANRPLGTVIEHIRDVHRLEAGIALNPETPISEIHHVLHDIDCLLVMGVHPGRSGQEFEGDYIIEKIKQAHAHVPATPIEIDGGVTQKLIPELIKAGATRMCMASAIFNSENPAQIIKQAQNLLDNEPGL